MKRLPPLPRDAHPELQDTPGTYGNSLGPLPNSVLIMPRKPGLIQALTQMASAGRDGESEVDRGFKRMLACMANRTHGCSHSLAHAAEAAHLARHGWSVGKHCWCR